MIVRVARTVADRGATGPVRFTTSYTVKASRQARTRPTSREADAELTSAAPASRRGLRLRRTAYDCIR